MDSLLPATFRESLAAFLSICSIIFLFISISRSVRTHALRIVGILIITTICLYANHPACYFAAVFILATAMTNVEFLQTLAAILRGRKDYFDYLKSLKSVPPNVADEKQLDEIEQIEIEECNEKPDEQTNLVSNIEEIQKSVELQKSFTDELTEGNEELSSREYRRLLQEYALQYLEKNYHTLIKRNVAVTGRATAAFDGVMQLGSTVVFVEIITSINGMIPPFMINLPYNRTVERVQRMQVPDRFQVRIQFVFVGEYSVNRMSYINKVMREKKLRSPIDIEYIVLLPSEVGLMNIQVRSETNTKSSPIETILPFGGK